MTLTWLRICLAVFELKHVGCFHCDDFNLVSEPSHKLGLISPLITVLRKLGSLFTFSSMFRAFCKRSCFCSIVRSFGTNLAEILPIPIQSSVQTERTDQMLKHASFVSSLIVIPRLYITWSMMISFLDVDGPPERPSLKCLYHSFLCLAPIASF
ncbi:hypothetical protein AVEN_93802-1 [Araneus ventricosus]|uniref:Uncharacterized protein n=1 Tax=Araneus ventricosus TaxID=182803 RepID=A0A4Y2AZY1_ARAVE|nr:hypothetical protein AVEN_93802-1 [Araneus ventricosus]